VFALPKQVGWYVLWGAVEAAQTRAAADAKNPSAATESRLGPNYERLVNRLQGEGKMNETNGASALRWACLGKD